MPNLITAHVTDERGVYQRTEEIDKYGPQPEYASYADLPEAEEGFTRVWQAPAWQQIPDEDVPDLPWPKGPVPRSVTPAQGLMALYKLHVITEDDILAAIDTIEDANLRYQALIAYKKAIVWERASVSMGVVAQLMGLTEDDLDELFTLGDTFVNL